MSSSTALTLQLFKNSTDTQGKLRLNLHSVSVLLEYRHKSLTINQHYDHKVFPRLIQVTYIVECPRQE